MKIVLDFLNGLKNLVFVRIYKSTFIGVVGPPYLVAFCAFAWLRPRAFCAFCAFCACKIFLQKRNKEFKTVLITSFTLLLI